MLLPILILLYITTHTLQESFLILSSKLATPLTLTPVNSQNDLLGCLTASCPATIQALTTTLQYTSEYRQYLDATFCYEEDGRRYTIDQIFSQEFAILKESIQFHSMTYQVGCEI